MYNFLIEYSWQLITMGILLAASAFASGTETALFSLTRRDVKKLEFSIPGRIATGLLRQPRFLLTTLLMLNMLANVAFSATAAMMTLDVKESGRSTWVIAAVSLCPLLLLILLGEVTPKMIAYSSARQWSSVVAIPVSFIVRVLSPLILVMDAAMITPISRLVAPGKPEQNKITPGELAALMETAAFQAGIPADTGAMFREIVELGNLKVNDIMIPRTEMVTFDLDGEPEKLLEVFRKTGLRKIPVVKKSEEEIAGVIHAKDIFLKQDTPVRELVRPVLFVSEFATLEKIMSLFREKKKQLAIVVDEYGGTAGLITLEDILEEIVGDIRDRHEIIPSASIKKCGELEYIVTGDLAIHEWTGVFKIEASVDRRISTFAGLAACLLGRIPRPGDTVNWGNLSMTVESVRRRRADRIRLSLSEEAKE